MGKFEHYDTEGNPISGAAAGGTVILADGTVPMEAELDLGQYALLVEELGSDPSTPASSHWKIYMKSGGLYYKDDAGNVIGPLIKEKHAWLREEQTSGTTGGTFTSGAWRTRTLNTETDPDGIVTLSANQFTLQAGTYWIHARCPAYQVARHQAKLYNVTDASDEIIGSSAYTNSLANYATTDSVILGRFAIAGAKTFEIQHRASSSVATFGFGNPASFGVVEVYTDVRIWKEF